MGKLVKLEVGTPERAWHPPGIAAEGVRGQAVCT